MNETPHLRWFEVTDRKCRCGKRATGILRGDMNQSFGPHCKRCAERRLKESAAVRAAERALSKVSTQRMKEAAE